MSWYPKGDLLFEIYSNKGQKWKYVMIKSTQTTSNVHAIPPGFLNRLEKLISRTHNSESQRVSNIYLDHENALHKSGLENSILPTMRNLWRDMDLHQMVMNTENDSKTYKNKNINILFCTAYSHYFPTNIHSVIDSQKCLTLSWIIVRMYCHRFNKLYELYNRHLSLKLECGPTPMT